MEKPERSANDAPDGDAAGTEQTDDKKPKLRPAVGPRVGIAQIEPALGDIESNLALHAEAVEKAHAAGIDILVFPELSLTGYRLKDTVPDVALARNDEFVQRVAALSADVSLVVGLVLEAKDHSFFNGAAYLEGGEILHVHRKVYLPTYGMFDEQRYFARGDRLAAFDTKHGRMAVLICEDMLHPSAITIAALDGAATVLVPSASPVRGVAGVDTIAEDVAEPPPGVDTNGRNWEQYNRTMARTLGIFVVHANRVGVEDGQTFWGGSEIVGPDGETLAKAAYYDADMISAVLPDSAIRRQRIQAPVLRDEDVDLTINELCRVRGRLRPAFPRESQGGRAQSGGFERRGGEHDRDERGSGRRDDRPRPYREGGGYDRRPRDGGGYDRRGGDRDRDDRGFGARNDRRGDRPRPRDGAGYDRRPREGGGYDRRSGDRSRDERGYGNRDDRPDGRPRPARDGDRPLERRPRPRDTFGGGGGGGARSDEGGFEPPRRERPGRGERTPRPVGGGRGRDRDKGDS